MGRVSNRRIALFTALILLTGVIIYSKPMHRVTKKSARLNQALAQIEGWTVLRSEMLDPAIVNALKVDDYVNSIYISGKDTVFLYIGYYYSSEKVGDVHSPLVCYPGQGWRLSDIEERILAIDNRKIHLSEMTVSRNREKHLVLFWFQSYDRTSSGTFFQKIKTLLTKISHSRQDNAFVRISIPLNGRSFDEAFKTGARFIDSFYPAFLGFITENPI